PVSEGAHREPPPRLREDRQRPGHRGGAGRLDRRPPRRRADQRAGGGGHQRPHRRRHRGQPPRPSVAVRDVGRGSRVAMDASTAPALAIAALLVLAGAQKVVDPTMTVGALRALRLPSSPLLVRAGAAAEAALGAAALTVGGPVLWALVAISYLAFAAFVTAALRSGTMIGSCGCFGRE